MRYDVLVQTCKTCGVAKPLSEFEVNRTSSHSGKTWHRIHCKSCWRWKGGYYHAKARYGLSREGYDAMLIEQGGRCAICGTPEPGGKGRWHIDHNHDCCPVGSSCENCVRGLLCWGCNVGLGCYKDSPELLRRAADYLSDC